MTETPNNDTGGEGGNNHPEPISPDNLPSAEEVREIQRLATRITDAWIAENTPAATKLVLRLYTQHFEHLVVAICTWVDDAVATTRAALQDDTTVSEMIDWACKQEATGAPERQWAARIIHARAFGKKQKFLDGIREANGLTFAEVAARIQAVVVITAALADASRRCIALEKML